MFLVNLSQDKSRINPYLSNTLLEKIDESLKEKKKIILYLNKRGEYSSLICNNCNNLYKCHQCDISMSVHKYPAQLICHICNTAKNIPNKCEKCKKETLQKVGIGTQQIEDSLKKEFKNYVIFRLDTDTVKNKTEKNAALKNLEDADIIIGTKMITTGFDFSGVGLIGVILLEQELLIPKYNTEEKVYSNIKQLLGRGSRNGEVSNVVIQTFIPENEIVKSITISNYKDFFIKTLEERKLFNYPPYSEMLTLEYRHKNKEKAKIFMQKLNNKLDLENSDKLIDIVLAPNPTKKYNQFYYKIILKGANLRDFINKIKPEILRNSGLIVIFE
ncbi:MAG: primosomal protein N' [Candidatus Gracilibacteria bacterium]